MEPIVFDDIEPIQIPVKVFGKWYALCEASEKVATDYQNASMAAVQLDFDKVDMSSLDTVKKSLQRNVKGIDTTKMGTARSVLLSGCLRECVYDEEKEVIVKVGDNVPVEVVENWPARLTKPLIDKAKEISELDKLPASNPFHSAKQQSGIGG